MPRNASGVYTLPAGNPVVTGTVIASSWANTTMNDIAAELTDSLSRSGKGGMQVPLEFADGTMGAPSITFVNDVLTGRYLAAAGDMRDTVTGTDVLRLTPSGAFEWNAVAMAFEPLNQVAADVPYDETIVNLLVATDTQAAIDENATDVAANVVDIAANAAAIIVNAADILLRVPKTGVQDTEDWAGTAYVDPMAVGANPTAKIYPDGTIIGSTDNGDYIRRPDGELECFISHGSLITAVVTDALFSATTLSASFPVAFVAVPTPYFTVDESVPYCWAGNVLDVSLTTLRGRIFGSRITGAGDVFSRSVGRWKV